MSTLSTKQLTQRLSKLEHQELVEVILNMCSRIREAKQYCQMEFGDVAHQAALLDAAKSKMHKHFFPARKGRSHRPRSSRLRAMLSDFKKIAVFPLHLADLTLYWVELAVEYIIHNHYVKDTFFAPTEKVMDEAADLICDHTLQSYFQARLEALRDQVGKLRYYDGFKHSIVATIGFMLGDE